jgi:hypothetical protein
MTDVMDRAAIEAAQEELLDRLANGRVRLKQLAYAAAMPGGDEEAMLAQKGAVEALEQKLEGLGYGLLQAVAQEREAIESQRLAERQVAARKILSLMTQRGAAIARLDQANTVVADTVEEIEELTNGIKSEAMDWFPGEAMVEPLQSFLAGILAIGISDILRNVTIATERYAPALGFSRQEALRSLAIGIPEVLDKDVQAEARAAAMEIIAAEAEARSAELDKAA